MKQDVIDFNHLTAERITKVEEKVDRKLDAFNNKLDSTARDLGDKIDKTNQSVATLIGYFETEEKNSKLNNNNNNGILSFIPWIGMVITVVIAMGSLLQIQIQQQDISTARALVQTNKQVELKETRLHGSLYDIEKEILRIRSWKDEVEKELPSHISASDAKIDMLTKTIDTLEERMTSLTKKFFEFQTCLEIPRGLKEKIEF